MPWLKVHFNSGLQVLIIWKISDFLQSKDWMRKWSSGGRAWKALKWNVTSLVLWRATSHCEYEIDAFTRLLFFFPVFPWGRVVYEGGWRAITFISIAHPKARINELKWWSICITEQDFGWMSLGYWWNSTLGSCDTHPIYSLHCIASNANPCSLYLRGYAETYGF